MSKPASELKERLKKALSIQGLTPIELSEKTKIPKSSISQYMSGYTKPKQDRIYLIAKALDVSESWLMGYDVPMERIDYQAIEKHKEEMFEYAKRWNIQYYEKELLKSFTQLSDSNKKKSIGYTEKLLQIQNMESEQQEHLIPNAAHERTDIVINEEDRLEDERMMADDGD